MRTVAIKLRIMLIITTDIIIKMTFIYTNNNSINTIIRNIQELYIKHLQYAKVINFQTIF